MAPAEAKMAANIAAVVFDLDGLLLDTERLVDEVCADVFGQLGSEFSPAIACQCRGKRPLEAAQAAIDALGVDISAEALVERTDKELSKRWHEAVLLPGAERLVRHLHATGVPIAIATSTSASTLKLKQHALKDLFPLFRAVVTGDQVVLGKPAPEIFEAACARLGADPARTLVFEDALSGVQGARAAGCSVVAVPSHQLGPSELASLAGERTTVLRSLLDCDLGTFGLPPFTDWVRGSLPLADPLRFRGEVIRGFGRGSQVLGIPTANLDASKLGVGAAHACGIYLGWASVGASSAVHKMVMSIGWNPFFKDQTHKTVEPWILHSFDGDFYGQELRLLVVGYLRPEADFTTLEALIAQIRRDAEMAEAALEGHPGYAAMKGDGFLAPNAAAAQ